MMHAEDDDQRHVQRLHLHRQVVDEIHLRVERNESPAADRRAYDEPDRQSEARADDADHQPLREEDPAARSAAGSPIAFRMPISRVLSRTTIVSVLTMLNAATITMRLRITDMPSFSSESALNSELFCSCQSTVWYGKSSVHRFRDRGRVVAARGLHLEARHRAVEPRELLRRRKVQVHVLIVVLVHPRLEHAGDLDLEQSRHREAGDRIHL